MDPNRAAIQGSYDAAQRTILPPFRLHYPLSAVDTGRTETSPFREDNRPLPTASPGAILELERALENSDTSSPPLVRGFHLEHEAGARGKQRIRERRKERKSPIPSSLAYYSNQSMEGLRAAATKPPTPLQPGSRRPLPPPPVTWPPTSSAALAPPTPNSDDRATETGYELDHALRITPPDNANMLRKLGTKFSRSEMEGVTAQQAKGAASALSTQAGPPLELKRPFHRERPRSFGLTISVTANFKWLRGKLIARGTYGEVYTGLNNTTGELIAVKQVETLSTEDGRNDTSMATVTRVLKLKLENEILKDLDHQNIVQYLGFEETPRYLAMFVFVINYCRYTAYRGFIASLNMFRAVQLPVPWITTVGSTRM
jgi:hypothetical protein